MIKLNSFVTGLILAKGQGLDTNRASKVALVTGFLGTTATSLILTNEMAKQEAASAASTALVTSAQTASTPTVSPEPECCKKLSVRCTDLDNKIDSMVKDLNKRIDELKNQETPEEQKQKQKRGT